MTKQTYKIMKFHFSSVKSNQIFVENIFSKSFKWQKLGFIACRPLEYLSTKTDFRFEYKA